MQEEKFNRDRRRKKRFMVVDLDVINRETDDHIGKLVNLSTAGMLVLGEIPVKTNSILKLRIMFTKPFLGREHFDIDARCVWCNKDVNPPNFSIGLMLLGKSSEQAEFMQRIIDEFRS